MRTDTREQQYQLHKITFSREQIPFLLRYLPLLREGLWLEAMGCEGGRSLRAPFETPILIAAEMDARLDRCGSDGIMAMEHYDCQQSKTYKVLSKEHHLSWAETKHRVQRVVNYISGSKRKREDYETWLAMRRPRREKWYARNGEELEII